MNNIGLNQYLGPDKVVGIVKEDGVTTPSGGEVIKVLFEKRPSERMTKRCFDLLVTDTPPPGEYNYLQQKKFGALIPAVIDLLLEYDLKNYEVGTFGKRLVDELRARLEMAQHYLWTGDDKTYVPGTDPMDHRSLWDTEVVLAEIKKKNGEETKN